MIVPLPYNKNSRPLLGAAPERLMHKHNPSTKNDLPAPSFCLRDSTGYWPALHLRHSFFMRFSGVPSTRSLILNSAGFLGNDAILTLKFHYVKPVFGFSVFEICKFIICPPNHMHLIATDQYQMCFFCRMADASFSAANTDNSADVMQLRFYSGQRIVSVQSL